MAETVKKSRIVSDDDLEETLMEEFNMRLKSCLSQDALETTETSENIYENLETMKSSTATDILTTKTVSHTFIETERREQTKQQQQIIEHETVIVKNGTQDKTNGHSIEENIYENVVSKNNVVEYMEMSAKNESDLNGTEAIYEDISSAETSTVADETPNKSKPIFALFTSESIDAVDKAEQLRSVKDRMFLSSDETSTLLFTQTVTSPMLTPSEENVDFLKGFNNEESPKDGSDSNSRSEESPPKSSVNGNDDGNLSNQDGEVELLSEAREQELEEPRAEKLKDQVEENLYENLETMNDVDEPIIYENVEEIKKKNANDCFNNNSSFENNSSTCVEDNSEPEVVSQIEVMRKTPDFDDDVTEISDVCSLDRQVSDSDSSNLVLDNSTYHNTPYNHDRFGVIQDYIKNEVDHQAGDSSDAEDNNVNLKNGEGEEAEKEEEYRDQFSKNTGYADAEVIEYIALTEASQVRTKIPNARAQTDDEDMSNECGDFNGHTRIVDEIVKNYVVKNEEPNLKNRERDTETVPAKIVQSLTSQFMKNGDEKEEMSKGGKIQDANQLKSVDIMKQINKFEHKDESDSTQISETYVETTTFDSNMVVDKAMKKKKTKKSRKEEKENISVIETNNLGSFYNVNVKSLCRSFGDLTKIEEKFKQSNNNIKNNLDRTRSKSLSDTYLTSNQRQFDKVFSGVSVKALKEKFNPSSVRDREKTDKTIDVSLLSSSSQNLYNMKSSFSKFDALQKKNVLHVRSSDSTKAQEKFNGTSIDTTSCKCCGKQVFQMEQIKAEKAIWHKNCFRCHECSKQLNVDTYESHEGTLYCKPHFRALFAPRVVDDTDEPPSDKPDLGLEELQSLNVKERFQVFEQHQSNESDQERAQVHVKRSPSILSKLAKFQAKGMDIGVPDSSLNGIPIEESSSEEEAEEEEIPEGEDPDLVRAKRVQKEKPFHFTAMTDVKNKWEHGDSNRDERREERKQEIQSIRNKLFMGKQGKMKEAYQEAVMKSESSVNLKKEEIKVCDTKTIKERFEKGEMIQENAKDELKDGEEQEIYESEISKQSRSLFLQLDANASKAPQLSPVTPPKLENAKKAREGATPEREIYHDPDVIRSEENVEDSKIAKESHTATKMLNKFRQMEENLSKESTPQGLKPLKRFTPPPEPARDDESSAEDGSESEEEEEESEQIDHSKIPDEDLLEAQKAARAKQLRAKFEKWEAQEIKREQNNSSVNIMEEYGEEQSQIESTKLLRARFESMRESHTEVKQPRVKVNRFVEISNIMENCEGCEKRVYPLEKISVHGHLFHKSCFKCMECSTILRMDSYTYNQGRLYCTPHFKRLFITKGNYDSAFGFDGHKEKWNSAVA